MIMRIRTYTYKAYIYIYTPTLCKVTNNNGLLLYLFFFFYIIIIKYFDKDFFFDVRGRVAVQKKIKYRVFFCPLLSRELLFKIWLLFRHFKSPFSHLYRIWGGKGGIFVLTHRRTEYIHKNIIRAVYDRIRLPQLWTTLDFFLSFFLFSPTIC